MGVRGFPHCLEPAKTFLYVATAPVCSQRLQGSWLRIRDLRPYVLLGSGNTVDFKRNYNRGNVLATDSTSKKVSTRNKAQESHGIRPNPPEAYVSCFSIPLSPTELRESQQRYLATPEYKYGLMARLLFWTASKVFPQGRSFEFFAFVELVARVPYMAWEHVGHIAQTQNHRDHSFDRKIQDRVLLARDEQDNELWHLLIMEEFLDKSGYRRRWFFDRAFPQLLSVIYYHLSWLLYVIKPQWSYQLNSDFEDHAMRQYALFVEENPEFDATSWESAYRGDYGFHVTVGDMLRQVAVDEEQHKDHSEDYIRRGARFSRTTG